MTVLFFVEPVVFRRDPSFLSVWSRWVAQIAAANRDKRRFILCSSKWLCDDFVSTCGADYCDTVCVSAATALRDVEYNRARYCRSLYEDHWQSTGFAMRTRLAEIMDLIRPQVVVSFTQNPHLCDAFAGSLLLFTEMGCLPRIGAPSTFFYDPCGHQTTSMLNLHWDRILHTSWPEDWSIEEAWTRRRSLHVEGHEDYKLIREWIEETRKGRRVRLLALQPPDWITFEGAYEPVAVEEVIYRQATEEPDALLVPVYHANFRLPAGMEGYIVQEFPQVAFPPPSLSSGRAELFTPHVDEVVTISSTVAVTAILDGKFVRLLGRCAFERAVHASNAVIHGPAAHARLRHNFLRFLTNIYLQPAARILGEPGFFNAMLDNLLSQENVLDSYFNPKEGEIDRARYFLGV